MPIHRPSCDYTYIYTDHSLEIMFFKYILRRTCVLNFLSQKQEKQEKKSQFFFREDEHRPPNARNSRQKNMPPWQRMETRRSRAQRYQWKSARPGTRPETRWAGLLSPSWERELDRHHFGRHISLYWSGKPTQHRQTNRSTASCAGACKPLP